MMFVSSLITIPHSDYIISKQEMHAIMVSNQVSTQATLSHIALFDDRSNHFLLVVV